jgi:two-component system OmpR family response regulator
MTRKLRIFLVEDNPMVRKNVIDMIELIVPCEVIAMAETEEEAVEGMRMSDADVFIIDVILKQGNGLEILRTLRSIKRGVWIVFSNHTLPELERMCLEYGADFFFDKTNEVDSLIQELTRQAYSLKE